MKAIEIVVFDTMLEFGMIPDPMEYLRFPAPKESSPHCVGADQH